MAHVEGPGRVGRHIFDVDALVVADAAEAVLLAFANDRLEFVAPGIGLQPEVDEAGPGNLDPGHCRQGLELLPDSIRECQRIGARRLGQDHRRVGRKVAMRGIARRLDCHALPVEASGKRAFGNKLVEHPVEER